MNKEEVPDDQKQMDKIAKQLPIMEALEHKIP